MIAERSLAVGLGSAVSMGKSQHNRFRRHIEYIAAKFPEFTDIFYIHTLQVKTYQQDFIFAIIIEELGLVGGAFVVLLYIILLMRAAKIAQKCRSYFPAFLVMGCALMLVAQAMLNMMVAVGLFPVTGQPLPLISRGGTSTIINCGYIGMILSVSYYTEKMNRDANLAEAQKTEEDIPEMLRDEVSMGQ